MTKVWSRGHVRLTKARILRVEHNRHEHSVFRGIVPARKIATCSLEDCTDDCELQPVRKSVKDRREGEHRSRNEILE
jgi:hypothetical protein